ncbi:MAG: DUF4349 domain-containing protein [Gemmataceae bacterium]|nr:DUF4349 domain-containing protein [Gemmataceae bacterium]MCI0739653.1 DUF4349 domain-containing protein [Gemmataceae bacterium]
MNPLWKKAGAIGFLVFLALWVAGAIRALLLPYPQTPVWQLTGSIHEAGTRLPQGNNLKQIGLAFTPLPLVLDQPDVEKIQVFDKLAQLAIGTARFDDDKALVRAALAAHQAVVFNERNGGIAPQQRLTLEVGVHPEEFDALVRALRAIARLDSISVDHRDRTTEFRRLNAQRQALKKHLEAVLKLRGGANNPSIDDTLKLEQKIQDIQKELQTLAVQLGEMVGKESYYLVFVTLFEYQPGSRLDPTFTLPQRLFHGTLWAAGWWLALAASIGALALACISVGTLWPKSATRLT